MGRDNICSAATLPSRLCEQTSSYPRLQQGGREDDGHEGCCRSTGGRAKMVVDDEGCRCPAGGRVEVVIDDEGCCRSAGGRAEVGSSTMRGAAALLAAEPRWSSTTRGAAAGGRAKVVVDEEVCRCSAGDSSTPVWSPSSSFSGSSDNGRAHLPASPRVSLAVVVVGGAISLGMAP